MIVERITTLAQAIAQSSNCENINLQFITVNQSNDIIDLRRTYTVFEEKIFYSEHIKYWNNVILNYLQGKFTLQVKRTPAETNVKNLFLNIHQLLSLTVRGFSEIEIIELFKNENKLFIKKSEVSPSRQQLISPDRLDNIVLLYHQYVPKPIGDFCEDYPSINQTQLYRSILRLSLLNFLHLSRHKIYETGSNDSSNIYHLPSDIKNTLQHFPQNAKEIQMVNLRKIINSIKKFK